MKNFLSQNLKYLRKENNYSQENLADEIGVKRSSIASYETKGIEPRLSVILKMAKLFNVSVGDLIGKDIESIDSIAPFDDQMQTESIEMKAIPKDPTEFDAFINKSKRIKQVLEGFKSFYNFKKNNITNMTPEKEKVVFDIDNFIQLMDHLLDYNDNVIDIVLQNPPEFEAKMA